MSNPLCDQARAFYLGEMNDYITYHTLARHIGDGRLKQLLDRVAHMERGHAKFWERLLRQRGEQVPQPRPRRWRLFVLRQLLHIVSPSLLITLLELGEVSAAQTYFRLWREGHLSAREREVLHDIILDELEHEATFHKEAQGPAVNNVRDFVLGMNDGLVEILGAVTGLSAAYPGNPLVVAVSGLIVGVAGALSMGIGAFISVRSQRQVNESRRERMEILFAVSPQRAQAEFQEKLVDSGLPESLSAEVVQKVGDNQESLARLLLEEVEDNEWRSALFTGGAYLFGVLFPVLPYFLASSSGAALVGSVGFAGLALAGVGSLIALVSGISLRVKVMEMLVAGLSAAGLAYLFGRLMQSLFGLAP